MTTDRTNLTLNSVASKHQTTALSGKSTNILLRVLDHLQTTVVYPQLFRMITVVVQIQNTEFTY